ncbi:exocyst complex component SEC10b isoform X4 [Physcomitrium patens]|uniref:exocyst complex component SEC10b isoform X4 n=1 Tax=Physcomitrium patens TaxID=3218 RepID=UPI000D1541F4|nr:exocyst complex component SEC10b-like isoform X4 [Physcomitrium patens]|eukprot:XP_024387061.1 exocyst complex component SEC10b-like isoform X4 [Physcomitrella patens]
MAVKQLLKLKFFNETFSFDKFFDSLVEGISPPIKIEEYDTAVGGSDTAIESILQFPEAPKFRPLFEGARKEVGDLCLKIDVVLDKLRMDFVAYENKHKESFEELQEGVEDLTENFDRLDSRVASVSETAAEIGDQLKNADFQKKTANETINLVRFMMYFNETSGYVGEEPSLFFDDDRVAEAAAVAQKLRAIAEDSISGVHGVPAHTALNGNGGLEVAAKNLQAYCNELENRLLGKFDAASQKGDLWTMRNCAIILNQFNKGGSVMQRYIASRPMFMDLEVMSKDAHAILGTEEGIAQVDDLMNSLASVYKEIADSVQTEAKTVAVVFPSPDAVMSILVQRVMEQRVNLLIEKIVSKPSLSSPPPMEQGGLLLYLNILSGAYGKTKELANEFQAIGCGELNMEACVESLFKSYLEDYAEFELTSLNQLHKAKVQTLLLSWKLKYQKTLELKSCPLADISQSRRNSILHPFSPVSPQRRNSAMHSYAPISVSVVEEFVEWNEEAVTRCKLLTLKEPPGILATNMKAIFTCLLDQVSQYVTEGLERAIEALKEAAALRERFMFNSNTNRKVVSAMAVAAEAASSAGESSFRAFMAAIQSATTNMTMLQRFFNASVSQSLLAQEGAHAACCDAIASAIADAENAALRGLQGSLDTVLAEVERLLAAEQKATDYKLLDESLTPEPTTACSSVITFVTRMAEVTNGALDGLNREAFLIQLGYGLYKSLIQNWKRFAFNPSGGLRLKRDVSEYAAFARRFMTPAVDEKFVLFGILIELRDDYKKAKVANILSSMNT